jgi:quercetin dioxygenase-like cupin family protein
MEKNAKTHLVYRKSGDSSRIERLDCYVLESLLDPEEEAGATVYRVSLGPHQRSRESYHRVAEEFYFVLSGRGTVVLNGSEHQLSAGDFLRLPPGTRHAFLTSDEPFDFLNIHVPGCRPGRDTYFDE